MVYGPRDRDVLGLVRPISKGLALEISGGERWFQAIYVKDLADGLLAAACAPRVGGRAYFLAHAKAVSWSELGSVAARIMRKRMRVAGFLRRLRTPWAPSGKFARALPGNRESSRARK